MAADDPEETRSLFVFGGRHPDPVRVSCRRALVTIGAGANGNVNVGGVIVVCLDLLSLTLAVACVAPQD